MKVTKPELPEMFQFTRHTAASTFERYVRPRGVDFGGGWLPRIIEELENHQVWKLFPTRRMSHPRTKTAYLLVKVKPLSDDPGDNRFQAYPLLECTPGRAYKKGIQALLDSIPSE